MQMYALERSWISEVKFKEILSTKKKRHSHVGDFKEIFQEFFKIFDLASNFQQYPGQ